MKGKSVVLNGIILMLCLVMITANSQWQELGGTNSLYARCEITASHVNAQGIVYVALCPATVYKFNDTIWKNCNASINNTINVFATDQWGNLYAAGEFTNSSSPVNFHSVLKYDGNTWTELGGTNACTFNGSIHSLSVDMNGNVYVAGSFNNALGTYIGVYNGSSWNKIPTNYALSNSIKQIVTNNAGEIYASSNSAISTGKYILAKYNSSAGWVEVGDSNKLNVDSAINTFIIDSTNNIYAAGAFVNSSGKNYVAKYDGSFWSELKSHNGFSFNGRINCLGKDDEGNIYAAGAFTNDTGQYFIAKYDGYNWENLGGIGGKAFNGEITNMSVSNAVDIVVTGKFTNSSNLKYVAKYSLHTLPVNFLKVNATITGSNNQILVSWTAANEENLLNYTIEQSPNGKDFKVMNHQTAKNTITAEYSWLDEKPLAGNNYFRIKALDKSGKYQYSDIVSVNIGDGKGSISVFPNPLTGKILPLQFKEIPKGKYHVMMLNTMGQSVLDQSILHEGGNAIKEICLPKSITYGTYIVRIVGNDGRYYITEIVVQ